MQIAPQLSVRRGRAAVDFYIAAFGAVEQHRVGGTDEHEDVVSLLSVGEGTFWVADEAPEHGAREVAPVSEEYGWLLGRIEDPFGHHWEIGRPLVPWPPGG